MRWTTYNNINHEIRFIITSKVSRDIYYLYEVVDNEFQKIGKGKTPYELEEKYNVIARL
jgi:hypothetical protein